MTTTRTADPSSVIVCMPEVASRNLAAECRWVEQGHHVHVDHAAGAFWTVSDRTGQRYEMSARALLMGDGTWPIAFGCTCPSGRRPVAIGSTGCKHRAGLARRLEREGLARLTDADRQVSGSVVRTIPGRWEATERALGLVRA